MANQDPSIRIYQDADRIFNEGSSSDIGFEALLAAQSPNVDEAFVSRYRDRYDVIKSFQNTAIDVFTASLRGDCDPRAAQMVMCDLPSAYGTAYHQMLSERQLRTPLFFRTDEPVPGLCSEIQCPGSGWDLAELLWDVGGRHPDIYGPGRHFDKTPALAVAEAMRAAVGDDPVVHHLADNASRPHGMRFWMQRTRAAGVKYFSYDRGVGYKDCNLVRSHDFVGLLHHNFFEERMRMCEAGTLRFDLPPAALFDGKCVLAWPFWEATRDAFSDAVRAVLPYTAVIEESGVTLADGQRLTLDTFFNAPRRGAHRQYFIKYAGTDIGINWGSRAVYRADTLARGQMDELSARIRSDLARGRYWVIQEALQQKEPIAYWNREGERVEDEANVKWSAFYGPTGLIGLLVFHRPSHKVHGGADTVMSLVR